MISNAIAAADLGKIKLEKEVAERLEHERSEREKLRKQAIDAQLGDMRLELYGVFFFALGIVLSGVGSLLW
jgi:hypothetical protein